MLDKIVMTKPAGGLVGMSPRRGHVPSPGTSGHRDVPEPKLNPTPSRKFEAARVPWV